jgi:predicted DNA-binding transcriptional regulator AlpA
MQVNSEYLDEKQVSQLVGRALSTLRNDRHLRRGLPYVKFGRSVRYSKADVIAFMEARKISTIDSIDVAGK